MKYLLSNVRPGLHNNILPVFSSEFGGLMEGVWLESMIQPPTTSVVAFGGSSLFIGKELSFHITSDISPLLKSRPICPSHHQSQSYPCSYADDSNEELYIPEMIQLIRSVIKKFYVRICGKLCVVEQNLKTFAKKLLIDFHLNLIQLKH